MPIHYNDLLIGATASFGVAPLDPDCGVEQSLDNADQALYAAKSAGRTCATLESSSAARRFHCPVGKPCSREGGIGTD